MDITRRNMLRSSSAVTLLASGAALGQVTSCGSGGGGLSPEVIDAINKAIASSCNAVAMVTTIAAIVSVAFPAVAGVATITTAVANEIAAIFCKSVTQPPAAGKYTASLNGKTVEMHGWVVKDNQIIEF